MWYVRLLIQSFAPRQSPHTLPLSLSTPSPRDRDTARSTRCSSSNRRRGRNTPQLCRRPGRPFPGAGGRCSPCRCWGRIGCACRAAGVSSCGGRGGGLTGGWLRQVSRGTGAEDIPGVVVAAWRILAGGRCAVRGLGLAAVELVCRHGSGRVNDGGSALKGELEGGLGENETIYARGV